MDEGTEVVRFTFYIRRDYNLLLMKYTPDNTQKYIIYSINICTIADNTCIQWCLLNLLMTKHKTWLQEAATWRITRRYRATLTCLVGKRWKVCKRDNDWSTMAPSGLKSTPPQTRYRVVLRSRKVQLSTYGIAATLTVGCAGAGDSSTPRTTTPVVTSDRIKACDQKLIQ